MACVFCGFFDLTATGGETVVAVIPRDGNRRKIIVE